MVEQVAVQTASRINVWEIVGGLLMIIGICFMATDYPPALEPRTAEVLKSIAIGIALFASGVIMINRQKK